MVELTCPWCEATLLVSWDARDDEQSCPECQTSWAFETTEERDFALVA